MVALFIINFNRQQIKKHTDRADKHKKNTQNKENINE